MINEHNYEAFFLDYLEGRLSPDQEAGLLLFLEEHPLLKDELEYFEMHTLKADDDIHFTAKNELKSLGSLPPITRDNDEVHFIAFLENELTLVQQEELKSYLKKFPERNKDFEIYQKTSLKADRKITYTAKGKLKKSNPTVIKLYWSAVAAAACWLIAINLGRDAFNTIETGIPQVEISRVEPLQPGMRSTVVELSHPLAGMSINKPFVRKEASETNTGTTENYVEPSPEKKFMVHNDEEKNEPLKQDEQIEEVPQEIAEKTEIFSIEELKVEPEIAQLENQQLAELPVPETAQPNSINKEYKPVDAWLASVVKRRVLRNDSTVVSSEDVTLGQAISNQVSKAVGVELDIEKNEKGGLLAFEIKVGKFELTRKTARN